MSDPYGPPPASEPNDPQPPTPGPQPPQYGQPAPGASVPPYPQPTAPQYGQPAAPQYGQPAPEQSPYGQPPQSPYGQPGPPAYGQPGPPAYGQYASMPSAPPATPYGMVAPQLRVGDALSFGWAKFRQNWLSWVVFALLVAVVSALLNSAAVSDYTDWFQRVIDHAAAGGSAFDLPPLELSGGAVGLGLLGSLVSLVAVAMAWSAALREADGARPSLGQFFAGRRLGMAVLTSIVVNIIGFVVAIVPLGSIAWSIFTVFVVAFVIDQGLTAFRAIGEGVRLAAKNFGAVFLLLLALLGINILGAIALVVGLLVTVPLSILALAYAFRRLTGGTIV